MSTTFLVFGRKGVGYQKTQEEFSSLAAFLLPGLTPYGRIMIDLRTLPKIFTGLRGMEWVELAGNW